MSEKFDFILFGATGLVGRYAVHNLFKLMKSTNLKWALACRNKEKLLNFIKHIKQDSTNVKIIEADLTDEKSLTEMVQQTKLILNTCGPLLKNGENLIKICIKLRTNYFDISAEPNFIEYIEMKYNEDAKNAGVFIVNSCGVDSLVYDMGVIYLKDKFNGNLKSIETYYQCGMDKNDIPGPEFNISTWKSAIDLMQNKNFLKELRENQEILPKLKTKLLPFKIKYDDGYAVPSFTADLSVMNRTQLYFYKEKQIQPIQLNNYILFKNFIHITLLMILLLIFFIFTKFKSTTNLLLKYPEFFSAGTFGKDEPTRKKLAKSWFRLILHGKGWKNNKKEKPDLEIVAEISGRNQGYHSTSLCLILSGIIALTENDKLPGKGGVYTPGSMFINTSLIELLNKNEINFAVIDTIVKNKY